MRLWPRRRRQTSGRPPEFQEVMLEEDLENAASWLTNHRIEQSDLRSIALGLFTFFRKEGVIETERFFELSLSPVYTLPRIRLAAAKLLAEAEHGWGIDLLRMFGWTGWQRQMFRHHPLMASLIISDEGNSHAHDGQLREWLEQINLAGISPVGWYDERLLGQYPHLLESWLQALTGLEPRKFAPVFRLAHDDRRRIVLARALTEMIKQGITVTSNGSIVFRDRTIETYHTLDLTHVD